MRITEKEEMGVTFHKWERNEMQKFWSEDRKENTGFKFR
jgi:hypothetical protein